MSDRVFRVTSCAREQLGNPGCPFHQEYRCWWTEILLTTDSGGEIPRHCPLRSGIGISVKLSTEALLDV